MDEHGNTGGGGRWDGETHETDFGRLILARIGKSIVEDSARTGRLGSSIEAIGDRLPGDPEAGRAALLLGAGIELTEVIAALRIILANAEAAQELIREQAKNMVVEQARNVFQGGGPPGVPLRLHHADPDDKKGNAR